MHNTFIFWVIFSILVVVLFSIDLYTTDHRKGKITIKGSLIWSAVWICTALLFNLFIYLFLDNGPEMAVEYLAGYIIEKSLSVDNLFVFYMIFNLMNIKTENQPHILKWGIISAIVLRVIFILFGVAMLHYFHPVIYIFGFILLFAAYKMVFGSEEPIDFNSNPLIKWMSKKFNLLPDYKGKHFFEKIDGKLFLTNLFITLMMIESADLLFAVDSIPAVLAISHDPFVVITSNIFAILGLRALFFALAGLAELFEYLKYGVGVILFFVGIKMILADVIHISTVLSLIIICSALFIAIVLSMIMKSKNKNKSQIKNI